MPLYILTISAVLPCGTDPPPLYEAQISHMKRAFNFHKTHVALFLRQKRNSGYLPPFERKMNINRVSSMGRALYVSEFNPTYVVLAI